jgi:2-phosphosulfolactate phosphatase
VVLTGSLVNAGAVARYITSLKPEKVSLVAMGYRAQIPAEEDLLCAELISNLLDGREPVSEKRISALIDTAGKRFFDPSNLDFSPPTDFFLCTMVNRFDFVLRAIYRPDDTVELIKIEL